MQRHFSHALIIILILLAPLSFSTDRVPDFTPPCDIQSVHNDLSVVTGATERYVAAFVPHSAVAPTLFHAIPAPSALPDSPIHIPSSNRAPPQSPLLLI